VGRNGSQGRWPTALPTGQRSAGAFALCLAVLALFVLPAVARASGSAYVANIGSDSVSVSQYAIGAGGELSSLSPATVAAGVSPVSVAVTPGGKSAYVTNLGDGVSQYDVDPLSGALSPKTPATAATGVTPAGVAVTLDGKSAYVTNLNDSTVSQYNIDPLSGALSPKTPATVPTGPSPFGIAVGPLPVAALKHATAMSVGCSPGTVGVRQSTTCTATVTDTASVARRRRRAQSASRQTARAPSVAARARSLGAAHRPAAR
jgi:Lactonase, 7-bladed beta-propeller